MKSLPPAKLDYKERREREFLTLRELGQLIDAALAHPRTGLRDAALISLIHDQALRVGEAVEVKWRQLDLEKGLIRLADQNGVVEERSLEKETQRLLRELRNTSAHQGFVFVGNGKRQISSRTAREVIAKAGKRSLPYDVHPDMLVHTRGVELASRNIPIPDIARFLRHSSLKAAKRYKQQIDEIRENRSCLVAPYILLGSRNHGSALTLKIPASISNLGPGLDTVAVAVNTYALLEFGTDCDTVSPLVKLRGGIAHGSSSKDQGELIYSVLKKVWKRYPDLLKTARLSVSADIALGTGLGISATVILGALWAAYVLNDQIPTTGSLIKESMAMEGHSEALAASLLGGLVVSGPARDDNTLLTEKIDWPGDWLFLAVLPGYTLDTPKARAALPVSVTLDDAIFNMQRTSLLVAAVANRNAETLRGVLSDDRLHEHYRANLVPHLFELRRELSEAPILGCILGGGGASVIVILEERNREKIFSSLNKWCLARKFRLLELRADNLGLSQMDLPSVPEH